MSRWEARFSRMDGRPVPPLAFIAPSLQHVYRDLYQHVGLSTDLAYPVIVRHVTSDRIFYLPRWLFEGELHPDIGQLAWQLVVEDQPF